MTESLSQLVEAARRGDQVAWSGIVMRLQRRVFAAALATTGDIEEADEVTQEAFVRLFERMESIRDPEAVGGWLVRTAINTARDRRRFRKFRAWFGASQDASSEPSPEPSPEVAVARREAREKFEAWSRARLSERERLVIQLRGGEEMTIEEIARELGISASAVKTHLARARKKLRPFMKGAEARGS
jgi:RNA polymerase sigma-70 factor (ECF subfamily)